MGEVKTRFLKSFTFKNSPTWVVLEQRLSRRPQGSSLKNTTLNLPSTFTNKRIIEEIAVIPSKPLRNKIAGFITHLMKRLQRSTVRGISIKLQEEERQRRDNYVPDVSALEQDVIEVDSETKDMLKMMDF